jgi:transcriptional regulator with XRE-family HTH domain
VTFQILLFTLRELLREKVKNGELTERGMARSTGVSQPHLHNILKGIRNLPPELADQLLVLSGLDVAKLLGIRSFGNSGMTLRDQGKAEGPASEKSKITAIEPEPPALPYFRLLSDPAMEPRFRGGDIVHYRQEVHERSAVNARSAYLVSYHDQIRVRYLRMGGRRLYLASEESLRDPVRWDYVSLTDRHILEIVRGRIVWICRKMEEVEAGASEETRGFDRRVG